jgi:hypothetical protein
MLVKAHPGVRSIIADIKGENMDRRMFLRERVKAVNMAKAYPAHAGYWEGYRRGLRRAQYGERFGTEHEHREWLAMADSIDESIAALGRGYRDGCAA